MPKHHVANTQMISMSYFCSNLGAYKTLNLLSLRYDTHRYTIPSKIMKSKQRLVTNHSILLYTAAGSSLLTAPKNGTFLPYWEVTECVVHFACDLQVQVMSNCKLRL